jgi:hypothetical protein
MKTVWIKIYQRKEIKQYDLWKAKARGIKYRNEYGKLSKVVCLFLRSNIAWRIAHVATVVDAADLDVPLGTFKQEFNS